MISENLWPTAILWLLKSMSEHVITMVDEETNKISSNLSSCSKVSMHFHFSSSGPRRSTVVVDDTSTNTNNENKHQLRATNYLDSVYWSYLRQLITMERSARQMRGRWAPSKGPAVGSASNLADGDTRDTLARLSFLPASPTPRLLIIRLCANRRLIAPPYDSHDLHLSSHLVLISETWVFRFRWFSMATTSPPRSILAFDFWFITSTHVLSWGSWPKN